MTRPIQDDIQLPYQFECECGCVRSILMTRHEHSNLGIMQGRIGCECGKTMRPYDSSNDDIGFNVRLNLFNSKSSEEKKKILKARSHADYLKNVKPNKDAIDEDFKKQYDPFFKKRKKYY